MEMVIIEVAVKAMGTLVITALGVLGAWLTAKIGQKKELESISRAPDDVIHIAQLTAQELQQTVVSGLKASHEDGKLTKEEINMLGKSLINMVISKLSAPTEQLLRGAGIDLEALIVGAGEAYINSMKRW